MSKKKVILMEYIWFGLAIFTLILFVYNTIKQGFSNSYVLLIFFSISILMYLWRKALRKRDDDE